MSKILPFRMVSKAVDEAAVDIRVRREDSLSLGVAAETSSSQEEMAEHHWGVAIALATWPLCLGASAVWLAL